MRHHGDGHALWPAGKAGRRVATWGKWAPAALRLRAPTTPVPPPTPQAMLKEGHKHLSGLEEAVLKNIEACKTLAQITRTSMGPNGGCCMVVKAWVGMGATAGPAQAAAAVAAAAAEPPPPLPPPAVWRHFPQLCCSQ